METATVDELEPYGADVRTRELLNPMDRVEVGTPPVKVLDISREVVFVYRPEVLDDGKIPEDPVPEGNVVTPELVTVWVIWEVTIVVVRYSLEELEDEADGGVETLLLCDVDVNEPPAVEVVWEIVDTGKLDTLSINILAPLYSKSQRQQSAGRTNKISWNWAQTRKMQYTDLIDEDFVAILDEVTTGRDVMVDAVPIQLQADEIDDGESLHWETYEGSPVVAVLMVVV